MDDQGKVRLQVVAAGGYDDRHERVLSPGPRAEWLFHDDRIWLPSAGLAVPDRPLALLPPDSSQLVAMAQVGGTTFIARDDHLYLVAQPARLPAKVATFEPHICALAAGSVDTLLVMTASWPLRAGTLQAFDTQTRQIRWVAGNVYAYPPLVRPDGTVVVMREHDRGREPSQYDLVALDGRTGTVRRTLPVTGPPVDWMQSNGDVAIAVVEDDRGAIATGPSNLFVESYDLRAWKRATVGLQAKKNGFGDVTSSLAVLPHGQHGLRAAVAVNGEAGRVRLVVQNQLVVLSLDETARASYHGRMVAVGEWLVLAIENRLHMVRVGDQRQAKVHFPDQIQRVSLADQDLLVVTRKNAYRLRPEPNGAAQERIDYVRARPWQFGDVANLLAPRSRRGFTFFDRTSIDVVFKMPTLAAATWRAVGHCPSRGSPVETGVWIDDQDRVSLTGARRVWQLPQREPRASPGFFDKDKVVATRLHLEIECRPCSAGEPTTCNLTGLAVQ